MKPKDLLTFIAISLFYLFETGQMSYYNVLAPAYLGQGTYDQVTIGAISAAYYYGDVVGLFPVGYALDRFSLRKSLIFALIGSIIGAFLLFLSNNFTIQWISRFICGFCGGTFSFIGGIRVISSIFKEKFSYGFSIFLSAGIIGAMLCQYPLLLIINHFGPKGAMFTMFSIGAFIAIFCYFFLNPPENFHQENENTHQESTWNIFKEIVLNFYNWCDVLMIVLLETPGTILGTLWGVVFIIHFFHFSTTESSLIITLMLLGSIIGLPLIGSFADKYDNKPWIIMSCVIICVFIIGFMFHYQQSHNTWLIGLLFFGLGFFYSCQTIGFHWVTSHMKPDLIGRNSAFNSIIFMTANGGLKQFSAYLLSIPAIFFIHAGPSGNLLTIILFSMLIIICYLTIRKNIFKI